MIWNYYYLLLLLLLLLLLENSVDILYLFRKLIMLDFCSIVNNIDHLTASVALTDFSP